MSQNKLTGTTERLHSSLDPGLSGAAPVFDRICSASDKKTGASIPGIALNCKPKVTEYLRKNCRTVGYVPSCAKQAKFGSRGQSTTVVQSQRAQSVELGVTTVSFRK